jgi:transposase
VNKNDDIIGFLDSTAGQNVTNTIRTLCIPGEPNTMEKNEVKIKVNETGFLAINGSSVIMDSPNTKAHEFAKILIQIRLVNTKDEYERNLLLNVLNNPNLTKENIITTLKKKRPSKYEHRETIINKLYDDNLDYDSINKHIKDFTKRQEPNNINKIDIQTRENLMLNLEQENIHEVFQNQKKIHIVLDNYSVHHSKLFKDVAEILNINLIYLPPYSPDLNPIEDVWRLIKRILYNSYLTSKNHIKEIFNENFYEIIKTESLYENWVKEYL